MMLRPMTDLNIGLMLMSFTLFGLIGFVLAVLIEAVVLERAGWGKFRGCLVDSLIMNVISTVLGVLGAIVLNFSGFGLPFLQGATGLILSLVIGYIGSVLIEGFVLWTRHARDPKRTFLLAALANFISYGMLSILILIYLI